MGNCPACLSSKHCNYSSDQDDPDLLRVADVLSKPLLKPSIQYYNNQHTGRLQLNTQLEGMTIPSANLVGEQHSLAPNPILTKENHPKVIKKVRFSDEVIFISTSNQEIDPFYSSANEREIEELFHKKMKHDQSSMFSDPSTILMDQSSRVVNQSNNIVRLKVVISKKELSELLLKTREKLGSDALMERIIAPLLSPQISSISKSQTLNIEQYGSPTWRPSLELISEDLNHPIDSAA